MPTPAPDTGPPAIVHVNIRVARPEAYGPVLLYGRAQVVCTIIRRNEFLLRITRLPEDLWQGIWAGLEPAAPTPAPDSPDALLHPEKPPHTDAP